ncbi:hypothetical protein [uncultured Kriegella sp.]|uniref:hypothetical protein n=1 Tax=uncultured Kriegella sp. TaxID=1798910 RepID=UPI0030DBE317|tara:strand:- start:298225 stop:298803 length:579 start_codon:yes stop_codon:yes gene_type:complete
MQYFEVFFTFVLVISTIVYVFFTYKLVQEARKTREIGLKPYMILYLDSPEAKPTGRYLNVKNVGQGVAQNVKFEVIKDMETSHELDRNLESRSFLNRNYLKFPPNYNLRHYIFDFSNNAEAKFEDYIEIKCYYEDIFGDKFSENFVLNFKDSFASARIVPPDNYVGLIAHNLEKINKNLEKINISLTTDDKK